MAKKATAKKSVKMPDKKQTKKAVKKTAKKQVKKSAKKSTDLRQKTIKDAGYWEGLMNDSGLDLEGSGLLAAEFASRSESTLASIWADLECARGDLEAIILVHGNDISPSELRKRLAK